MPQEGIDLSVIIPAYNEAERIPKTLKRFQEYFTGQICSYEIIVVVDGVSNNTRDVLAGMAGEIRQLKIIDRPINRGKGFSVREGMLKACGRVRLFTDADNSADIAHFAKMRPLFEKGYDVVIASRDSRDVPGAQQIVTQPWTKRLIAHLGNLLIQLIAVPRIWDTQCGFKAFRAEVAERIFPQTEIDGWGFDIELLALARALNFKIGIIPVSWVNDNRSHVRWLDYFRVLGETIRVRYNLTVGKYHF